MTSAAAGVGRERTGGPLPPTTSAAAGPAPGRTLIPYLPNLVHRWVAEGPEGASRWLEGSLVFADISGFTRLSERLSRLGPEGAEALTDAISACFSRLLAVAYGDGGSLLKFGGDALLLSFTGPDHELRASRAAIGMRRSLREIGTLRTPAGAVVLRMSVGLHRGRFPAFLVGSSHRELLLAGPDVTTTVRMESLAGTGQIAVSPQMAAALPPSSLGPELGHDELGHDELGPARLLRQAPTGLPGTPAEPPVVVSDDELAAYLPVAVRTHLITGSHEPEHRTVALAFLRFTGTDDLIARHGIDRAEATLSTLLTDVQQAIDGYGVSFVSSDVDADGGKIVLAAGAPLARDDDDERLLLAVRGIVATRRELPIQIGVHRGSVFAGDVGPHFRRTYTVMGDTVNLTARVMARATPGQILATTEVLERSRTRFETTALPPFTVKGKRHPVTAFDVGAAEARRSAADDTGGPTMVGRSAELAVLTAALEDAREGFGRLVEISGEPGLGKSRLLTEVHRQADDTTRLTMVCQPSDRTAPYAPFRPAVRALLGIDPDAGSRAAGRQLLVQLERSAPHLLPWAPLIASVADADVPETAPTRDLHQDAARRRLQDAVLELGAQLLPGTTLVSVEDAHWMDEASADLLQHLGANLADRPWLVCVTRRVEEAGPSFPDGPHVTRLTLTPLTGTDATALAEQLTQDVPLSRHATDTLVARAGGNPLLLLELADAATELGDLDDLPASVEALLRARIDRLPRADRDRLRHLSILGHSFTVHLAEAVLPAEQRFDDASLGDHLAVERGVVRFRHGLLREAAYSSVPFRTRRRLHAEAADTIRQLAGDEPERHAGPLSFHYFHARRHAEAWSYAIMAAGTARERFANAAAVELYRRALAAGRHVEEVGPTELATIWELLGDVHDRMGEHEAATTDYRTSRRHLGDDPVAQARLMLKLAWQQGELQRYSGSLRWISRALRLIDGERGTDADRQRALLTAWHGHYFQRQGRHLEAIDRCRQAVELAERSGEVDALARAYRTLDWAHVAMGELDEAVHSELALRIHEQTGDLAGQADVLANMAAIAYFRGRWDEALSHSGRAAGIEARIGRDVDVAINTANTAEILLDQGRLDPAAARLDEVARTAQAAGRRALTAFANRCQARIAARRGQRDDALRRFDEAMNGYTEVGARAEVCETRARLAEAYVLWHQPSEALREAHLALEVAATLDGLAEPLATVHRVRGYALLQQGDASCAEEAFHTALETARARSSDLEVALALDAQLALATHRGHPPAPGTIEERRAILHRLGVVDLPRIPLTPAEPPPEASAPREASFAGATP